MHRERLAVLRNGSFLALTAGQAASQFGSSVYTLAVIWWALEQGGSSLSAGLIAGVAVGTGVIIGPVGGALADYVERRRLLVLMDLLGGVLVGFAGLFAATGRLQVSHLLVVAVGTGITGAVVSPTSQSLIPAVLPEDRLTAGNSVFKMAGTGIQIAGPAAAGILLAVLPFSAVFFVNAGTYVFAAILELTIGYSGERTTDARRDFLGEVWDGIALLRGRPALRNMAIYFSCLNLFLLPLVFIGPVLINRWDLPATYAGLTESLLLAGVTGAGLFLFVLPEADSTAQRWQTTVGGAFGLASLLVVMAGVLWIAPSLALPVILLTLFLAGLAGGVADIESRSLLQSVVEEENMGKVFGVVKSISSATNPVSFLVSGYLLDVFQAETVLFLMGTGALVTTVAFVQSSDPGGGLATGVEGHRP